MASCGVGGHEMQEITVHDNIMMMMTGVGGVERATDQTETIALIPGVTHLG